ELYTHYHFMKMALDEIKKNPIIKSQKNTLSKDKTKIYKSVMFYFQNKFLQALKALEEVSNNNSEKLNNEMVVKMKLFEIYKDDNFLKEIKSLEESNSNNIISRFNSFIFKKFILKENIDEFLNSLKNDLITKNFSNREGLVYIPDQEKDLYDYFKYEQGQIIFEYGLDTNIYYDKLLDLIIKVFSKL
ncbi:MAG: hypothetical protein ACK4IX_16915, partial [Candidatus Sericytochromatia bacterium]